MRFFCSLCVRRTFIIINVVVSFSLPSRSMTLKSEKVLKKRFYVIKHISQWWGKQQKLKIFFFWRIFTIFPSRLQFFMILIANKKICFIEHEILTRSTCFCHRDASPWKQADSFWFPQWKYRKKEVMETAEAHLMNVKCVWKVEEFFLVFLASGKNSELECRVRR